MEPAGTVPTPAEPGQCSNPVDGRSIARFHMADAMGYERWRYRGYVNLYRSERNVAEKSPIQVEQTLRLAEGFTLHYGDVLPDAKVAFRLAGPEDAPVIAVLGGISAHRIVAGSAGEGWWPELVGPGLGVDTRSYRVLGMDYLGGHGDSSTPEKGGKFPPLSSYDQAAALCALVRYLRLTPLNAIVGASYGDIVALRFTDRYAELV